VFETSQIRNFSALPPLLDWFAERNC